MDIRSRVSVTQYRAGVATSPTARGVSKGAANVRQRSEIGVLDARILIYLLRLALFGAISFVTFLAAFMGAACFVFRLGVAFLAAPWLLVSVQPSSQMS
jgi:hypothetical protein